MATLGFGQNVALASHLRLLLSASFVLAALVPAAATRTLPGDADVVSARVLSLVNDARSRPRRCGSQTFAAARPLTPNPQLERAALLHSREMARYSFIEHQGRDGSTPGQRVTQAGYRWSAVAENVAAGQGTADEAMAACYWTLNIAAPR